MSYAAKPFDIIMTLYPGAISLGQGLIPEDEKGALLSSASFSNNFHEQHCVYFID
jgi:hypothetical protein